MHIVWKKYQVFSKASEKFIEKIKMLLLTESDIEKCNKKLH